MKIVLLYIIIIVPIVLIGRHFIDFKTIAQNVIENFSDGSILLIFFISESIMGMIPPDLFVIWATKFDSPFVFLALLGILSYIGGVISYLIGYLLLKRARIKAFSDRILEKYIGLVKKWGGAFIIISALFPFSPFSMVVIAGSLLKYPFRLYLLFGISRIARFIIQGILYLHVLNTDHLFV